MINMKQRRQTQREAGLSGLHPVFNNPVDPGKEARHSIKNSMEMPVSISFLLIFSMPKRFLEENINCY